MADLNQESRTARATIAITPTEKRALQFIANVRRMAEAEPLRTMLLDEIVSEYERLMAKLRKEDPGKAPGAEAGAAA